MMVYIILLKMDLCDNKKNNAYAYLHIPKIVK